MYYLYKDSISNEFMSKVPMWDSLKSRQIVMKAYLKYIDMIVISYVNKWCVKVYAYEKFNESWAHTCFLIFIWIIWLTMW